MATKRLVVANWKMNPASAEEARNLFISAKKKAKKYKKIKVILCPPAVFLASFSKLVNKSIELGAQDVSFAESGSFTGEIGAPLLKNVGVTFAVVGHSERRAMGEIDELVARKASLAIKNNITPILCVGESQRDIHGEYLTVLKQQLFSSLSLIQKKDLSKIIIAYEPVWAIGRTSDDAVTPDKLHQTSLFIKKLLLEHYGITKAVLPKIIYGGSVEPANALGLISEGDIDGFLVGHESLSPAGFGEIMGIVNSVK
jgi:triosephosphate isomerase